MKSFSLCAECANSKCKTLNICLNLSNRANCANRDTLTRVQNVQTAVKKQMYLKEIDFNENDLEVN